MRNNLKHFSDLNTKVYNLDNLSMPGAYYLQEGFMINIQRKGCNKYGNPLYHLFMEDEHMSKIQATKGRFGRVLTDKTTGLKYLTFLLIKVVLISHITAYDILEKQKGRWVICGIKTWI